MELTPSDKLNFKGVKHDGCVIEQQNKSEIHLPTMGGKIMKKLLALTLTIIMAFSFAACSNNSSIEKSDNKSEMNTSKSDNIAQVKTVKGKILVVYFSRQGNSGETDNKITMSGASLPSGNTRQIADEIHGKVGGDIFEIKTVDSYSPDYNTVVDKAKQEQEDNYRPKLATKVQNIDSYDVIFIGYPNWWGTMPMAVFSFLEQNNLSGKTIVPFCTHEGSALGQSVTDLKKLCPKSTIAEGLAIRAQSVKNSDKDVTQWLRQLGMVK